jgi:hypothetical protein
VQDSFSNSRHASDWTFNCVVLLDNVDTAVGHDFLDELVMARRQRAAYEDDDPDPLTVVATSHGDLAERVRLRGESAVTLTSAGYADYLARSQTHIGRWWYPELLPDLTLDEVGNMVSTRWRSIISNNRMPSCGNSLCGRPDFRALSLSN